MPAPRPAPARARQVARREANPAPSPRARFSQRPSPPARASVAARASNGAGIGRSMSMANYRGRVAAHLARYKNFPAAARASGGGAAVVTFTVSGAGAVTSVRLARGSGQSVLDRESLAMVRRASPFPAPPDGRPKQLSVPIRFGLR